jgi:peptide/nickel transport system substrate-binding protein
MVRIFGSEQALVAAMRADELDLAWDLVPSDAALLAKASFPSISTNPFFAEFYIGANVKVAPFDDLKVRQAIAYGLDRDRIVKQAFASFGTATCLPWRPDAPGLSAADNSYYTYDPAKARALFKAAGAPSKVVPIVVPAGNPVTEAITNIAEYDLTKIGFKVKVQQVQQAQFAQLLSGATIPGLWVNSVGQCDLSIATVLLGNAPFKVTKNTSNVTAPEYVSLANKVIDASSDSEIATAQQALTKYVLEQAWHMTIGHVPYVSARTSKLSGVSATAGLAVDLTNAKLA